MKLLALFLFSLTWDPDPVPVTGRVVTAAGSPVLGASVELAMPLEGAGWVLRQTTSGAGGEYYLTAPAPGLWQVRVSAPGYRGRQLDLTPLIAPTRLPPARLSAAGAPAPEVAALGARPGFPDSWKVPGWGPVSQKRPADPGKVAAASPPKALLSGETRAPDGAPLAGSLVWVHGEPASVRRSDRQGRFSLPVPVHRLYLLAAVAPEHALLTTVRQPAVEPTAAVAALPEAHCRLLVQLRDVAGEPIPDVEVALRWARNGKPGLRWTHSNRLGEAELHGVPCARSHDLWSLHPAYYASRIDLGPWPEGSLFRRLAVTLSQGVQVTGSLVSAAGGFLEGAEVTIHDTAQGEPSIEAQVRGRFAVPNVAPGSGYLTVSYPGHGEMRLPVEVPAEVASFDLGAITVPVEGAFTGRVVDEEGGGVAAAEVYVLRYRQPDAPPTTSHGWDGRPSRVDPLLTDEAGYFELTKLSEGTLVKLEILRSGYQTLKIKRLEVGAEATAEFVLEQAALLMGRVLSPSGAPAENSRVAVQLDAGMQRFAADTDQEGRFSFDQLPPGPARLIICCPHGAFYTEEVELRDGMEPLAIQLEEPVSLSGRVLSRDGVPLAGAELWVVEPHDPMFPLSARTAADGTFDILDLPPGEVTLEAKFPGYRPVRRRVSLYSPVEGLEIRLGREATVSLSGYLRAADGGALAGVPIGATEVKLRAGAVSHFVSLPTGAVTGPDGSFRLDDLPANALIQLTEGHPGYRLAPGAGRVQLAGQPVAAVDLVVEPAAPVAGGN